MFVQSIATSVTAPNKKRVGVHAPQKGIHVKLDMESLPHVPWEFTNDSISNALSELSGKEATLHVSCKVTV